MLGLKGSLRALPCLSFPPFLTVFPARWGAQLCPRSTCSAFSLRNSVISVLPTSQGCWEDQVPQMNVHPKFEGPVFMAAMAMGKVGQCLKWVLGF